MATNDDEVKEPIQIDGAQVDTRRDGEADSIIRKHMGYAMAGGAVPIPILDLTAVTAVQLDMLKQLAKNYEVELDGGSARTFLTSLTSALGATGAARIAASAVKLIPGVGWAIGGATQVVVTGASTYAVGSLFKRLFREKRPLDDLDAAAVKDELKSYFDAGKDLATSLKD